MAKLLALCLLGSLLLPPSVASDQSCPNSSVVEADCTINPRDKTCWLNCGKVYKDDVLLDNKRMSWMQCSCDARCLMYGDCCPDYLQACNATIETHQTLISAGRCLNTYFPKPFSKFYLIADCHPRWTLKTIIDMCRNETGHMTNVIPVTDIDTNISYTNVYCAMCNFVRVARQWNTTIQCISDHTNATEDEFLRNIDLEVCMVIKKWPGADQGETALRPRLCFFDVDHCTAGCENEDLMLKCAQPFQEFIYSQPPRSSYMGFKNRYCARCFLGAEPPLLCGRTPRVIPRPRLGDFSFSLLSDFSSSVCPVVSDGMGNMVLDCEGSAAEIGGSPCNDTQPTCVNGSWILQFKSLPFLDSTYSEWLGALSLSCVIASIICLAVRLILHPFIPSLHNLAGKNQLSLSIAIFFALVAFLAGPWLKLYETSCKICGLFMHWAFLSSFMWMSAIALDTWLVFRPASTFSSRTPTQQKGAFVRYSLFSWILPALIVASAFALDLAEVESDFRPYYGAGLCWIAKKYALVVFFGVPLGMVIIVNSVLYILTATHLYTSLKISSSMASSAKEEHHFGVYVRLFLLMGATWTTAYVATFVDHDILWAVYTVLNASQGVFISLSSLCTIRVYRDLGGRKSVYSSKTPSTSITATKSSSTLTGGISTKPTESPKGGDHIQ